MAEKGDKHNLLNGIRSLDSDDGELAQGADGL